MEWIKSRLAQGSSHAGIAALLQGLKFFFPAYAPVIDAGSALFGAIAVAVNS
jgi:hypothetical protein